MRNNLKAARNVEADLSIFTEAELCEIYDAFDRWEWPELLGKRPEWWDDLPDYSRSMRATSKYRVTAYIRQEIRGRVSQYKILEYHWVHNLHKTEEEYREWLFREMAHKFLRPQDYC